MQATCAFQPLIPFERALRCKERSFPRFYRVSPSCFRLRELSHRGWLFFPRKVALGLPMIRRLDSSPKGFHFRLGLQTMTVVFTLSLGRGSFC